jgi:positive regulator of sigma E activity
MTEDPRQKRMNELMNVKVEIDEQSRVDASAEAKRKELKAQIENNKRHQLEVTRSSIFRQNMQIEDDPISENPLLRYFFVFYIFCLIGSLISFWIAFMRGSSEFFTIEKILGLDIRPYVLMNLITALASLFLVITKTEATNEGLQRMLSEHGMLTAEERTRVETRVYSLARLESICRYIFCVLTFTLLLSAVGWEAIIATLIGPKASILTSLIGGSTLWFFLPNYFKE